MRNKRGGEQWSSFFFFPWITPPTNASSLQASWRSPTWQGSRHVKWHRMPYPTQLPDQQQLMCSQVALNSIMSSFLLPCSAPHSKNAHPGQTDSALNTSLGPAFQKTQDQALLKPNVDKSETSLHTVTNNFLDISNNFPSNIQQYGFDWLCTLTWRQQRGYSSFTWGLPKCPLSVFITNKYKEYTCMDCPITQPPKMKWLKTKLRGACLLGSWYRWHQLGSFMQPNSAVRWTGLSDPRRYHLPLCAPLWLLHEVACPPQMSWSLLIALCTQISPTEAGF